MKRDWIEVELKQVSSKIQYGFTASSSKDEVGPRLLRITDIQDRKVNWEEVPYCEIDEEKLDKYLLETGDLLFARTGATVGKSFLIRDKIPESVFASYLIRVQVNKSLLEDDYLSYFFDSPNYWVQITENQSGIGQPNVNGTKLGKLLIPIAPLPEQRAIVARIEELVSELDHAIVNLKSAQAKLEIYRQAVLKKAFEGGFTNGAKWQWKKIRDCGSWKGGGTPSKANHSFWESGTVLWVSPKDMKEKFISNTIDKITEVAIVNSSTKWISGGSVLFVVRSGILRRTLPIAISKVDLTVNQDLQAFTPNSDLDPVFVYWFCKSRERDIRETCAKDGTTVESVDSTSLKNYLIPLPSTLEIQNQIVQEIESRLLVADKLAETIQINLLKSESLRQSILKQSFEGKLLTEGELEACRKEADWEPAESLLERINIKRIKR